MVARFCSNMDGGSRVLVMICIWKGWKGGRVEGMLMKQIFTLNNVSGPAGNRLYPPNRPPYSLRARKPPHRLDAPNR